MSTLHSTLYTMYRVPDVEIGPSNPLHSRELLARQDNVTPPSNLLQSTTETTEVRLKIFLKLFFLD